MTISRVLYLRANRCSWTVAGIALQPLDVYSARPLKPVLKFKLHPMTYSELVHPVAAGLGPLKANFLPIFGQNTAGTIFPRNPRD